MALTTVAVTGGSGFIATELIKQLLEKGYNVNATVRNKNDSEKVDSLIKLGEALPGTLELFEADLMDSHSFDAAFKGCLWIMHTASPFFIESKDPQRDLVDVAVIGTQNVMEAAARAVSSGLKRVILTSSCAAIKGMKDPSPPKNGKTYSEEDWNETSSVSAGEAYWLSKTLAEKKAWELSEQLRLELITILPEFVMGPLISKRTDGTSVGYMKSWVEGGVQTGAPVFVDVRDVAKAHILAAENPAASGRYIVANDSTTPPQRIAAWLQERFPEASIGRVPEEGREESKIILDNGKARRELGLVLTPVRCSIVDMAVTMVALGLANLKPKP